MTAPASPIATQETPMAEPKLPDGWLQEQIAIAKATVASWPGWKRGELPPTPEVRIIELAEALSSAERRNEELVRERDEARERATEAHSLYDQQWHLRLAAEAALASLTGQVGEMREALKPFGQYAARWDRHTEPFEWRGVMYPADAAVVHVDSMIKVPVADHSGEKESEAPRKPDRRITIGDFRRARALAALEPSPLGVSTTGGDGASGREDAAPLATTPAPTLDGAERR